VSTEPAEWTEATGRDPGRRELDVLLLGATGFTGGLVAHELARLAPLEGRRIGIAGRDAGRLTALAATLPGDVTVVPVDVTDDASLAAAARRTRVLATTVGPYARLGVPVARACAEAGTHYADITGEEGYVRTLERDVDAIAHRTGATMVVCCGFDAVPHDLGVQLAVAQLPDDADVTARGYVRARGRMSGGTAATMLDALSGAAPRVAAPHPRDTAGPPAGTVAGRLQLGVHRPAELGGWAVPMPTVDPLIVLRSARRLNGYGATFVYGHFAHLRRTSTLVGAGAGLGVAGLAARTRAGRAMLERFLPSPGEGPDAATRARSRFAVTVIAKAFGAHEDDDRTAVVRVSGGDPGYGETSRMLAHAALTLAGDERPDARGVVTPAVGLGVPYRRRLEQAGISFELLESPA
jgi:short subunit dehydrogenase-like uncharacterized protein